MVCAQRLVEYIRMEPEIALQEEKNEKIKSSEVMPMTSIRAGPWKPTRGEVVIRDVSMRYGKDLPLVLRGLNVKIRSGTCLFEREARELKSYSSYTSKNTVFTHQHR